MRKKSKRNLDLSTETLRVLELSKVTGGMAPNETWTGFGSLNGKSCNTCNLGFP